MSHSRESTQGGTTEDLKLFRVNPQAAFGLATSAPERTIQEVFETNLERLLGIRLVASNLALDPTSDMRIDTLGLDLSGRPVIVTYAGPGAESAVMRGLFWLDWLTDHSADFDAAARCSLSPGLHRLPRAAPRLLCLAPDFSRYDIHVVNQMRRHVELLRYRRFDRDYIMTERVHTQNAASTARTMLRLDQVVPTPHAWATSFGAHSAPEETYTISRKLLSAPASLRALFEQTSAFLHSLGGDMSLRQLKYYHAYRRLQNVVCLDLYPAKDKIKLFVRLPPGSIALEPGFTRDVRRVTHIGTGDLEITLRNDHDLDRARALLLQAYWSSDPGPTTATTAWQ